MSKVNEILAKAVAGQRLNVKEGVACVITREDLYQKIDETVAASGTELADSGGIAS